MVLGIIVPTGTFVKTKMFRLVTEYLRAIWYNIGKEVMIVSEKMAGIIYELRTKRKESQEQVADAIGISRVAYTRYENGTRSPGGLIAMKLARHFGVTIEELFGETGQIKNPHRPKTMRI